MSSRTVTLEEIRHVPLEEIIQQVIAQRKPLTIQVSMDEEVTVQLKSREASDQPEASSRPVPNLIPLPVLDGYIPEGWEDAIYS